MREQNTEYILSLSYGKDSLACLGAIRKMEKAITEGGGKLVQYLGIAADEPDRIATHIGREGIKLPLVELGWEEDLCGLWCKYNGLLSPTYENAARDGCWFCHNQGVDQLRSLRKMYHDLWELLLKWDIDSPVTFKPGRGGKPGKTVHDYERRFKLEDDGVLTPGDARFRWSKIDEPIQLSLF